MSYSSQESGDLSTTEFRVYAKQNGSYISYLHDIPLYAKEDKSVLNMVVEIPRGTNAKMEICLSEEGNPIKQDVKNGKLRIVDDVFPYTGYIWNYGALPQTWEDPTHKHPDTQCFGDNDPLDACEIGSAVGVRGEVKQVKPLGVMALIDEGETDWKVIVIDVNDPRADEFNDITDVQRLLPGFTMATYEWFRTYKIPAGKPANEFAFNGEAKNREYTAAVIEQNHQFWKRLASGEMPAKGDKYNLAMANVSCEGPHKKDALEISTKEFVPLQGEKQTPEVPPVSIKRIVEEQQCNQPHGTADLSMVIQALAGAAQKGVTEGAAGIRQVLSEQACRAVYNADSETPESTNADGHYTIHYYAKDGLVVYGVYQQSTPHTIGFSAAEQVTGAGYDMVAAAFARDGKFTFTTGHGAITFTVGGVVETDDLPQVESDNLLAVKAPLAFFQ